MMFKLKHKLLAMAGMAASLMFGAENVAAEIDARFADEASFRTYFRGLTTQYDKDWALAAAVVYCKPELAKIALDGGASINTTVEQVKYDSFGFDDGRWLFINGEEIIAPPSAIMVYPFDDAKDDAAKRYELAYDGYTRWPPCYCVPNEVVGQGVKPLAVVAAEVCADVRRDSAAMAAVLYDYGADYARDGEAAMKAAFKAQDAAMVQALRQYGVAVKLTKEEAQEYLSDVREAFLLEELLAVGAEINGYDKNGATPLMRAAAAGRVDMVRLLLAKGADVRAVTRDGKKTVLLYVLAAADMNEFPAGSWEQSIRILLDEGAVVDDTVLAKARELAGEGGHRFVGVFFTPEMKKKVSEVSTMLQEYADKQVQQAGENR